MPPTPNPPIPGHHLIAEGLIFPIHHHDRLPSEVFSGEEPREFSGGCQCGARPPDFPNLSARKMKDWHRQHKEELRMSDHPERTLGTTRRQDEIYVLDHAKLLVRAKLRDDGGMTREFKDIFRDLRTAVAFLEAHGEDPDPDHPEYQRPTWSAP